MIGAALLAMGDFEAGRAQLLVAEEHFAAIGAKPELERTRSLKGLRTED
jgi:hypothetical protein